MTDANFTQVGGEAWVTSDLNPDARWTQVSVEAWVTSDLNPHAHIPHVAVEVWVTNRGLGLTLPIYPVLPGLTYSVHWITTWPNLPTQVAAAGAEIDLALASAPIHEFELIYSVLRNTDGFAEERTMRGFFMRPDIRGNAGRFAFLNPKDYFVVGETSIGMTDGASSDYLITRTYGDGSGNAGVEPVGYVNTDTEEVHVYLDGVETVDYEIDRSHPCNQLIHFFITPVAGQAITIDCFYYYYCKFADDHIDIEEFMLNLHSIARLTLRSCRAGA